MFAVDAVRAFKLHRRAMVKLWRREDHRVDDEPQGSVGPGAAPAGAHGHAHPHVLLQFPRLQASGRQLPPDPLPPPPLPGDRGPPGPNPRHPRPDRRGIDDHRTRRRLPPGPRQHAQEEEGGGGAPQ